MAQPRRLWRQIFINFIDSLKSKEKGILVGKDHFGTEYYEFPHKIRGGKKSRWHVPADPDNFEQEIPAEWEAWLRHRRQDPPIEEEIQINRAKMMQTIEKARRLEKPKEKDDNMNRHKFPTYTDFEEEPGSKLNKKV